MAAKQVRCNFPQRRLMTDYQNCTTRIRPARRLQYGLCGSTGSDGWSQSEVIGQRGDRLQRAHGGTHQNAGVFWQVLTEERGSLFRLFYPLGRELAFEVGRAILSFRVSPQNQVHVSPQNITVFCITYTVYTVSATLL